MVSRIWAQSGRGSIHGKLDYRWVTAAVEVCRILNLSQQKHLLSGELVREGFLLMDFVKPSSFLKSLYKNAT